MKAVPIYIQKLHVENIKTFVGNTELHLTKPDGSIPQWTLLLGDNGIGKSTLLQLIAWMKPFLPYDAKDWNDLKPAPIINDEENEVLEGLVHKGIERARKATIIALFVADQKINKRSPQFQTTCETRMIIGLDDSGKLKEVDYDVSTKADNIFYSDEIEMYAYSASRQLGRLNLNNPKLLDTIPNFIQEKTELYDAEEILHTLNYAALGTKSKEDKKKYRSFIRRIKKMLITILPDFEEIKDIEITPPKVLNHTSEGGIVISTKYGQKIPFGDFSLGYKTVASWTIDLAWRLFNKHHTNSTNPLSEPAIVLIDEIDLHLHPLWQRTIMSSLSRHFPNIQFIASAHSPFMAQSAESENLCVVNRKNNEVSIENEPFIIKGWRIGQIVTSELFGLPSDRGPDEEEAIQERRQLISKPTLNEKEEIKLKKLNEQISDLPVTDTEDEKIMQQIREAALLLKEKGIIND